MDAFTGADGAAWNVEKWTTSVSNGTVDILTNAGRLAVTAGAYENVARALGVMSLVAGADLRLTYDWASNDTAAKMALRLFLRSSGDWATSSAPTQGYYLEFASHNTDATFGRILSGSAVAVGTVHATAQPNTIDPIKVAFRVEGANLKAKFWLASAAEPAEWTMSATDTNITGSGILQVVAYSTPTSTANNQVSVDDAQVHDLASERLAPDFILSQTNLAGVVGAIQDDPNSPDANWLTA